ncbi:aminotransferase class I/II-fold pyridoxal phosphate-dependent enzyme [Caminicella sporogenes]|uniref:aminotransferase class I/II-fold pyridoxal phosphate-dependent enzyme n=1 Tax=Caminicella sporogenes TaxID=166485 RepID=UPI00253F7C36|nr:aminotransferase class I/II-fold pyridoxal phosphate-dependent enzyme [Caminicella sporogenes]WIF95928.1 aminotransferase class I/II-fold pyridoxal phosphate-dependent enzyme [Caminicella sporogenes]
MDNPIILNNLIKLSKKDMVSFHVPGHKNGKIFEKYYRNFVNNISKLDTTEIYGNDNLHFPKGMIKEAQEKAAKFYGAYNTFFLINGTTCGIYAMIMAATNSGDKIIVTRDCHRSVINAIILGGLVPVYVMPQIDNERFLSMGVTPHSIERALKENPDAKAVVITYPNYYGICSDIKKIANIVHKYNKLLLVDEAHGAHLKLHYKLPMSSLELGADIVVQSTHKTLPSFTQSSLLHVKSKRIDLDKLKFMLSLNQSSSPSYILMTSLDMAITIAMKEGQFLMDKLIDNINEFVNMINNLDGIDVLSKDIKGSYGAYDLDITKITISMRDIGIDGVTAEEILRKKYNIQVEMADMFNILAVSSIANEKNDFERLSKAIKNIHSNKKITRKKIELPEYNFKSYEMKIIPREAVYMEKESIPFTESKGKISGEYIIPYPPGIPLICPGEIITEEVIEYVKVLKSIGLNIIGMSDEKLDTIKVII